MPKYNKTYINKASGKERKFDNGGSVIQVSFAESELETMGTFTTKKGEKYFQFHIAAKRDGADEFDNTHYLYRLDKEEDGTESSNSGNSPSSKESDDDLPF